MIRLKINKKRSVKVPTCYEELDFGRLEKLAGLENSFDIIEAILELSPEEKAGKFDPVSAALVMRSIKFLEKPLPDVPLNRELSFRKIQVTIKSLESLPIAAYKDMQRMSATKDGLAVNKWIVAIYLQNATAEEYNFEEVEELLPKVAEMDCLTVMSLSNFFFRRLIGLRNGTVKILNPLSLVRWRLWQALRSLSDSISLTYYRIYVIILMSIEKRF